MNERDIFIAALQKEAQADRRAYLDEACKGDDNLRRGVEVLLEVHGRAGSFLESPVADLAAADDPLTARLGTAIGPYRLLEQIGEGGFGVVYLAEQEQPVRRKVALKIIKPGMDSKHVIARFEAERQALAMMDHPNIARVLDAGSIDGGRPYFVMELVAGTPITGFCDQNQLHIRERLELFVTVCQAVQHAHQKGIIHRDLKPSNVLVTQHDDEPVVKVIDFGIAKALGQERLTDKTLCTGFAFMIGTPLYMSPEQATMRGQDADTRTDIYSLGVLLYELLTGTTPFDKERLKEASYEEIRRIIREEEPAKPSTRISTLGQAATTVSANRKSDPRRLSQLCRGELDWIVMKALEKDHNRRYETASSLAADVQRYLHDEPVLACPPSAVYRFRKFAWRNKAALMTAAAIAFGALLAVAGLAVSYAQIKDALQREKQIVEREQQTLYFQRIKTAARELASNHLGQAELSLDECPPERRGWEWHYFKRRRHEELRELPHPDAVPSVRYSSDGRSLALAGHDGTVAVWDTRTWQSVRTWKAHAGQVYGLAFSPDSNCLATGGVDKKVCVWSLSTWAALHTLTGHSNTIRQLAFSADGWLLASASEDETVRLWDLKTGQETYVFRGHRSAVRGLAFHAAEQCLISASADGSVMAWDPTTGRVAATFQAQIRWISTMAFHPASQRLALGSWDGSVELLEINSWRAGGVNASSRTLYGHTDHITGLAFSPNGQRLVSAGDDRGVRVWDTKGEEAIALDLETPTAPIGVAFSPDGHQLAVGYGYRRVKLCDATPLSGKEMRDRALALTGHQDPVLRVAFSPDNRRLASASRDGTVKIWNTITGEEQLTFRQHRAIVSAVALSPDGQHAASGSWDENVLIWNASTGQVVYTLSGQAGFVYDVAFSPDGKLLASAHANGSVIFWDPCSGKEIGLIQAHTYEAVGVAFSPEGKLLATSGGRDHTARIWDVETRKETQWLEIDNVASGRIWYLAFSPAGKVLATVGHGNLTGQDRVMIWDVATGKRTRLMERHTQRSSHVAFSSDGRWLAVGGWDEAVWVWDTKQAEKPIVLPRHAGPVSGVAFSPDGRHLASCGGYKGKGEIKIWDARLWQNPGERGTSVP